MANCLVIEHLLVDYIHIYDVGKTSENNDYICWHFSEQQWHSEYDLKCLKSAP